MAAATTQDLMALARVEARRAGLDDDVIPIFLAQIQQESNWNPKAVSRAGARGLGQLMPATAKELGVDDPFDPQQNLSGSARYLKQQIDRFGDVGLGLAAYNWGPGNVNKLINNPKSVRIPKETQDYVPKILKNAVSFGSKSAPSNATMAFFPPTADVMKLAVNTGVDSKIGRSPEQVATSIRQGTSPSGAPLIAPVQPSSVPMEAAVAPEMAPGAPPGVAPAAPATLATEEATPSSLGLGKIKSLDDFLKTQFGPMAKEADPFPRGYDSKLLRLIDQA